MPSKSVTPTEFDVAVIGTGIVGLATALGFSQQGFSVALVGPPANPHRSKPADAFDPRIYAIAPASVELLERLAVWGSIDQQRTCAVERMRVFGDAGDELTFDAYGATVERLATIIEEGEVLRDSTRRAVSSRRSSALLRSSLRFTSHLRRSTLSLKEAARCLRCLSRAPTARIHRCARRRASAHPSSRISKRPSSLISNASGRI